MNSNKKVHLVLSSGGARGVAHIGIIEGLLDEGYEIKSIAGSSMGAVVGGVYAAGKLKEFKEWITNLDKMDVFKLVDFTLSTQGFIRGEKVFNEMKTFIPDSKIENLDIPFIAIATDISNKKEVVFKEGSLYTALRASAAIPSVLMPAMVDDVELVDGGLLNPIPINHITREDGELIVVSDVNADIPTDIKKPTSSEKSRFAPWIEKWNSLFSKKDKNKRMSYFEIVAKSVDLMQDQISALTMEKNKPDLVIRISRETCSTFEFYRSKELVKYGREKFNKAHKDGLQKSE